MISYPANGNLSQTPAKNRFGLADPLCVERRSTRPLVPLTPTKPRSSKLRGQGSAWSSYSTTLFPGVREHATTRRQVFEIVAPGRCCPVVLTFFPVYLAAYLSPVPVFLSLFASQHTLTRSLPSVILCRWLRPFS